MSHKLPNAPLTHSDSWRSTKSHGDQQKVTSGVDANVGIRFQIWPLGAVESVTGLAEELLSEGHSDRCAVRQQLLKLASSFALDGDEAAAMVDGVMKNTGDEQLIKGAVLCLNSLTIKERQPADPEPRDVVLARLACTISAPLYRAAYLFTRPATCAGSTFDAPSGKKRAAEMPE